MQLFSESSFLQALAYSLIASVWQMGVLWLAVIVVLRSFKLSAAQKFNLAYGAQLSGFALFIYTCINAYKTGAGKIIVTSANAEFLTNAGSFINAVMPYAAALYLGILLYKLVKLSFVFGNTQQLKKQGLKKIAAEQRIFVQECTQLFSIHRKVKIYLSEKVICPLTTGFLKPVILIPIAAVNHLSTQQLEAVILHELAHIKRADYLLYILQNLVEKIFFFNIFSIMLGEIIERERENACDDWVLQFRYNSMHYAEALFKLGRLKAMPAIAMPLQGRKENLLLFRIKRLLHNDKTYHQAIGFRPVLFGLFSLIIAAGMLVSPSVNKKADNAFQPVNVDEINIASAPQVVNVTVNKEEESAEKLSESKVAQKRPDIKQQQKTKKEAAPKAEKAATEIALKQAEYELALKQNYLYNVSRQLDSLRLAIPEVKQAVAANVQLNTEQLQKAISYQNFKQLEAMLAATGDSISVKESKDSKGSYKKLITIESFDKNGNKHVYSVVVELYQ
ncbi:M56 family metallopeptidase [Parafilimonas terrae]|uniref:BlaR1 peptidase M56 n=1 Tax=Parafilimonas terrae TaxID=1465490 RepID=A0A1I5S7D7_9BACT|nr:M56 family metallopeptidase [Parafilimonas terrae]SFP66620.1 BlaR1 peptidase M56 [Parafilimonas terrae]